MMCTQLTSESTQGSLVSESAVVTALSKYLNSIYIY